MRFAIAPYALPSTRRPMTYPCPCCGYLMFPGLPGTNSICRICFWHDDACSLRFAGVAIGPNRVSLVDAQKNFASFGAKEWRCRRHVRAPTRADVRDPAWRPIDPALDVLDTSFDDDKAAPFPNDKKKLYYWRSDYWLKKAAR